MISLRPQPALNLRRSSKRTNAALVTFAVVALVSINFYLAHADATAILWSSPGGSAWLSGANWTGTAVPTGAQIAQFGANPTSGATGVGINMGSNSGAQSVGAIEVTSSRTAALFVGDSNTTVSGILTFNGVVVNSINDVILRNNSNQLLTIQDTQGSAGARTMGVALGDATDNIISIDGAGGVTLSSSIGGASRKLTRSGAGTGTLTLSGVNTYSGETTINGGTLALGGAGSIANSPNIVINGNGTFDVASLSGYTLAASQGLKTTSTTSTANINTNTGGHDLTTGASSPLQFTYALGGADPLTVKGSGSLMLQSGNPVTVTVTGAPLTAGDYTLINKGSGGGTVAGTTPTSLTMAGSGIVPGLTGSLQITGSQLVLHVAVTPVLKYRSRQSGNWNDFNTWQVDPGTGFVNAIAGQTPKSADDTITIQNTHIVTVTAPVNADQLTVNTGALLSVNNGVTFTIDDGAGTDMTVASPAGLVGTAGTITNNGQAQINGVLRIDEGGFPGGGTGTYTYDQTTGALAFNNSTGPYGVNNDNYWPTVNGPQNVSVASGGIQMNVARAVGLTFITSGGINGAGNLTFNDLFNIFNGGYVSGSPTYGSASTLQYSTGTTYGRNGEWLAVTSGGGYPANVQLSNNTTLDMGNGGFFNNAPSQMSGSLTIDSGSTLSMTGATPLTQPLTVLGALINNGALTLSSSPGGDIKVGGNWIRAANGTFTPNSRAAVFNGTTDQTITVTGGGTETFNYLVVNKTSGSAQPNNSVGALTDIAVNATTGDALQLLGSSAFNLNGRTLTMSGNGGNLLVSGGARNVTSTGGVGNFTFSGAKTVTSASGGTLSFSAPVKVNLSASVNFGGVSTVSGALNILPGGAINANPPTYASGSILNYDSGGPYDASAEFPANGVQSVSLASTTQLNLDGDKTVAASFNANSKSVGSTGPTPFSLSAAIINVSVGTLNLNNVTTSSAFNATGAANINVAGNWNVAGFSAGTSTVNFNGAGAQSIQTMSAFNNLTASNDITLGANTTVNGTLTLGAKKITTGANTLIISNSGSVARTNGYIIGTEQRAIDGGSFTFDVGTPDGYSPLDAYATTGTGSLSVKPTHAKQPNIAGANALARYWMLSGTGGITTNLTFHYLATDVSGTESNYQVIKYDGSFNAPPDQSVNTAAHTATVAGVNSFSDWTLAEASSVFSQLQFSAANYNDSETNATHNAVITVQRTGGTSGAVSAHYATSDGTATDGSDYTATSGDLNWTDGDGADKTFNVSVNGDTTYEADETVNLTLSNATGGATIGGTNPATLTITNDDAPPPGLSIGDTIVSEPQSGTSNATFTVTLSAATGYPVSIDYATADGTAHAPDDYDSTSDTLNFAPGETTKQITVAVKSDALSEGNETFTVKLSNPGPSLTLSKATGQGTIVDPVLNGQLIISEFRFHGAEGPQDEFVELYNNTNNDITVATDDGTPGWTLAAIIPPGTSVAYIDLLATIPNGTVIPARAHLLFADAPSAPEAQGYSLNVAPSLTYDCDIDDGAGVALFRTAEPTNFNTGTRLDAAGFSDLQTPLADLFREGAGLTSPGPNDGEYSFVRSLSTGLPKDSNDNAADFIFVSTDGGVYGGVSSTLGAPGPENRTSPINRGATIKSTLIDPAVSSSSPPNRVRDTTSDDANNSHFGTLVLRRKFTNRTGANITRLRFRIVDVTTRAAGAEPAMGTADVRVRASSSSHVSISGGGTASISGLTLETPPAQSLGGGLNSTLAAGAITLATPLSPTDSINVEFLLGVQQTGSFRFFVIVEALLDSAPVNPPAVPAKHGTDKPSPTKNADKTAPLTVKMN